MKVATFIPSNKLLQHTLPTVPVRRNSSPSARVSLSPLADRFGRSVHGFVVDSNDIVRTYVAELLQEGLSQVVLSSHMGVSPTWFNRWINEKDDRVLPMSAVDGLLVFLHQHQRTTQRIIQGIEEAPLKARTEPATAPSPARRHPHRRK